LREPLETFLARLEPDALLEVVRIIENSVVEHFRINLEDNGDGTCTGTWTLIFTALNERGNEMVEMISEEEPLLRKVIRGLDHFLTAGERMPLA